MQLCYLPTQVTQMALVSCFAPELFVANQEINLKRIRIRRD